MNKLQELRKKQHLTQKQVAELLGVKTSIISKYECNKTIPPMKRLIQFADLYGVDTNDIIIKEPGSSPGYRIADSAQIPKSRKGKNSASDKIDITQCIEIDIPDHTTRYRQPTIPVHLVEYVRRLIVLGAGGKCELCHSPAPFNDRSGRPYLQLYEVDPNYAGSDYVKNYVGLCFNCTARLNCQPQPEDQKQLEEIASHHNY